LGGYVDFDWFSTEKDFSESTFFDGTFAGYNEDALTLTELRTESTSLSLLTGSSKTFTITAVYKDGHTEDITTAATYTNSNPDIVSIKNGQFTTKASGSSTITVSYQGAMGGAKSIQIALNSTYFPLTKELFNPSVYGTGTYTESTHTLVTGQYGFGGWTYSSGINLSAYKYLVVKLTNASSCGASFRLFDENNYWTTCAQYDFGTSKQLNINLASIYRNGTATLLNPAHLYIIGIWSYGGCNIAISDVYVTNNNDYSKPTELGNVNLSGDENEIIDVYNLLGVRVKAHVVRKEATKGLIRGIYIVGNQKVIKSIDN
jgi:hypothetical protein